MRLAIRIGAVCLLCMGSLARSAPRSETGEAQAAAALHLGWQDAGWIPALIPMQILATVRYTEMRAADTADLHRDDLIFADRWVAGTYWPAAALASDVLVIPFCALPVALSAWDAWKAGQGPDSALTDAVIFGEALGFSSALDLMVRSLRIHPRPLAYGTDAPRSARKSGEASGSFYSGHANAAFLTAVYLSYTYPLRHPDFQGQAWLWAGSLGGAATVAGLRVAAGKHFPSDVIVGAAAGAFFGWFFPRMHLQTRSTGTAHLELRQDGLGLHPMLVWNLN